jgi:WD40 repeat protein
MRWLLRSALFGLALTSSVFGQTPVDRFGDPLPPGAVLRLGTVRLRQPGDCHCVAFSPGGKVLASGGMRSARLWDPASGKKLAEIPHSADTLAFSPDGKKIALAGHNFTVGGSGKGIALWDVEKQKELWRKTPPRVPGEEAPDYRELAFARDGAWLAVATQRDVALYDVATGEVLLSLAHGEERPPDSVRLAVSPDGKRLAYATNNIRIWDLDAGGEPLLIKKAHDRSVTALVFSTDGKTLISGGHRYELVRGAKEESSYLRSIAQIRTWDVTTGTRTGEILGDEPSEQITGLALAPRASALLAGLSSEVRVFQSPSGELDAILPVEGRIRYHWTPAIGVSPDGGTLAVAMANSSLQVWDLKTRTQRLAVAESHTAYVRAAAYSPDGTLVATGSADGTVRLWDATTGKQVRHLVYSPRPMNLMSLAFSPDGKLVAAAGNYSGEPVRTVGAVKIWHVASGELAREIRLPECGLSLAFSPDGARLAVSLSLMAFEKNADAPPVSLFDVKSGKELVQFKGPALSVIAMAFAAGGKQLVTVSQHEALRVWDASSGKEIRSSQLPNPSAAALTADGRYLATGPLHPRGKGGKISLKLGLWNVDSGERLREFEMKTTGWGPHAMDISRDGRLVVCGSQTDTLHLVDVASGREVLAIPSGDSRLFALALSPDGRRVVTGMDDGSALIWDVSKAVEKLGPKSEEKK